MKRFAFILCAVTAVLAIVILCSHAAAHPASQENTDPPTDFTAPQESAAETLPEPTEEPQQIPEKYTEEDVIRIAQTVFGEAVGTCTAEKRLVVWCICNRVDAGIWGNTIEQVVTKNQFFGYLPTYQPSRQDLALVRSVLEEWDAGCAPDVLPPYAQSSDYLYFYGDGKHNYFRAIY